MVPLEPKTNPMAYKRFQPVTWYCPGYVPDHDKASSIEEALQGTTLVSFREVGSDYYIPVFNTQYDCDVFVRDIVEAHDIAMTICKFQNLSELYKQVKEDFKDEKVKIVIQESTRDEV